MDSIFFTNASGRLSRTDTKFCLLKHRMDISIPFARSGDQNAYQDYTDMMLRQTTHRQTLADRVSIQREKHRERIALQRRGLQHPSAERKKSYSLNSYRPLHYLSVRERQGFQLRQEMTERANRYDKAMALQIKTAQSHALLRHLAMPINFALIYLLDSTILSSTAEFEDLAGSLVNLLEIAVPHITSMGPGCLPVGWCWEAFDKVYTYLQVEAEYGRVPDEWSKYGKSFKELARMVTSVMNKPSMVLVSNETAMEYEYEETSPSQQQEVKMPCSTAGTTVPGPDMLQTHPEDGSEAVSSHTMATKDNLSPPNEPDAVAAHGISSQSSASSGPAASTKPVQSLSKAPEAIAANVVPRQSSTTTEPLAQAVPAPLPNQTVGKGEIRAQILSGTGRFDVNSISSMEGLIFLLTHLSYNVIRNAKTKTLRERMMAGFKIDEVDIEFLLRSCQYVLSNANAPWFNKEELLEKANEWWEDDDTGMWRLKTQLVAEGGDHRPEAVKKLGVELQNLFRLFYVLTERKVKPMRRSIRGG
ncbi:hypothetical protein HRS9122_09101 [Pyrenophora teres f. teres]|nr:hypothetical protein HRS9122_09101 [Pyrenophora teres f. teres]